MWNLLDANKIIGIQNKVYYLFNLIMINNKQVNAYKNHLLAMNTIKPNISL